jgi:micrococcal nuclease
MLARKPPPIADRHSESLELVRSPRLSHVIDGDTVVLQATLGNDVRVRLDGIDAPERGQLFYGQARAQLDKLLRDANLTVVSNGVDRYGRMLGTVYIGQTNVCLVMVECGLAWHFKKYSTDLVLSNAEVRAREQRAGLWQQTKPVPPWEYRRTESLGRR